MCFRVPGFGQIRQAGGLLAGTLLLITAGCLIAVRPALAGEEPETDVLQAAPTRAPSPPAAEPDDGFLPITKVVPRAKIVLHGKERLPDREGEKTFAAFGARYASPNLSASAEAMVPMYAFAYHPLYFEDMNLERCGLSCGCCVQPVVSGALFFGTVALLPYKVLVSPPCSYVFPPGECPPGYRFGYCENVLGPTPDIRSLIGSGLWRREKRR